MNRHQELVDALNAGKEITLIHKTIHERHLKQVCINGVSRWGDFENEPPEDAGLVHALSGAIHEHAALWEIVWDSWHEGICLKLVGIKE